MLNRVKVCNTYQPGQVIFYQGNPCLGIYCIMAGTVAIRLNDAQGNSAIVRLAHGGETIGYRAFFAGQPYHASAEALTSAKVCFVDKAAVRRLLEAAPAAATTPDVYGFPSTGQHASAARQLRSCSCWRLKRQR